MYLFSFRAVMMTFCMFVAGLLCHGCTYDNYLSLVEASFLFGLMSSAIYCFSTAPTLKPFFQKIGLFSFLMNTFLILILWKFIPGFHLTSSSTALWVSGVIMIISFMVQFFSVFNQVRTSQQKVKIKRAKAKVISSQKNSLQ